MPPDHDMRASQGADQGSPTDRSGEAATLLYHVIEALTALGNYLAAARDKFAARSVFDPDGLGEALEKSFGQYERAREAASRLRDLMQRSCTSNDNTPPTGEDA